MGTDITNTATANATPAGGTYTPITDDAVVTVEAPAPASTLTKVASNDTDVQVGEVITYTCLLYTSPSPRDKRQSRMPSSA